MFSTSQHVLSRNECVQTERIFKTANKAATLAIEVLQGICPAPFATLPRMDHPAHSSWETRRSGPELGHANAGPKSSQTTWPQGKFNWLKHVKNKAKTLLGFASQEPVNEIWVSNPHIAPVASHPAGTMVTCDPIIRSLATLSLYLNSPSHCVPPNHGLHSTSLFELPPLRSTKPWSPFYFFI